MTLNKHEKEIRQHLIHHKEFGEVDELWSAINAELHPKKKKKNRIFIFWLFGVAVLLSSFHFILNRSSRPSGWTAQNIQSSEVLQDENPAPRQKDAQRNPTIYADGTIAQSITIETNLNQDGLESVQPLADNEDQPHRHHLFDKIEEDRIVHEAKPLLHPNNDPPDQGMKPGLLNDQRESILGDDKLGIKKPELGEGRATVQPVVQDEYSERAFNLSSDRVQRRGSLGRTLPIPHFTLKSIDRTKVLNSKIESLTFLVDQPKRVLKRKIELGLEIGWVSFQSDYKGFEGINQEYIQALNQSNQAIGGQSVGMKVKYPLIESLFLETGLSYTRLVNRTRLNNIVEIESMSEGIEAVYFRASGQIEDVPGPINIRTIYRQQIQWHTYRHLIDLPLSLTYNKTIKRYTINASAGLVMNLTAKAEGAYVAEDGLLNKFETSSSVNPYPKTLGLSYQGKIGIDYQLTPKWNVSGQFTRRVLKNQLLEFDHQVLEKINFNNYSLSFKYRL